MAVDVRVCGGQAAATAALMALFHWAYAQTQELTPSANYGANTPSHALGSDGAAFALTLGA